jgi:hypothetical protein
MPERDRRPNFAERNGATVLLFAGGALILAAIAAVFLGHQVVAEAIASTGVIAVVVATVLSRMEGEFKLWGLSGRLRPSVPVPSEVVEEALRTLDSLPIQPIIEESCEGFASASHSASEDEATRMVSPG